MTRFKANGEFRPCLMGRNIHEKAYRGEPVPSHNLTNVAITRRNDGTFMIHDRVTGYIVADYPVRPFAVALHYAERLDPLFGKSEAGALQWQNLEAAKPILAELCQIVYPVNQTTL